MKSAAQFTLIFFAALVLGCASKDNDSSPDEIPIGVTEETSESLPEPEKPPTGNIFTRVASSIGSIFPGDKKKAPEAVPAQPIGMVKQVNTPNKFVLIDATLPAAGIPGAKLVTINDGQETADLKLTALRSGSFLIADITGGSPEVGDKVFLP